jgi:hypothetical protein
VSEPNKIKDISPPRWMSRAEKKAFIAVIEARKAASNPVLSAEIDLVVDYVESRGRLTTLRKLLRKELTESTYGPSEKDVMALTRQIDTTTSLSRRLARELGLGSVGVQ